MIGSALVARAQVWWPIKWVTVAKIRSDRRRFMPTSEYRAIQRRHRKVYVDVSVISRLDAGTGIQRVTRSITKELLTQANGNVEIIAVSATRKRRYAPCSWPDKDAVVACDISEIKGAPGDIFLGLDFSLDSLWYHRRQIRALGKRGMQFWYVMYDLLPHRYPQWFSDALLVRYRRWLRVVTSTATGFFCISPPVADDLREWLIGECRLPVSRMPQIEVMPMGWEIEHAPHSLGVRAETKTIIESASHEPMILMVGTIEPRKGHEDVISAFDLLWREGEKPNLVIAGRPGWKTETLQRMLRLHPMSGKRLFWLQDVTDEELARLYRACFGVICASHAEGFGLPMIEALGYGKPVLARDIKAFRMHSAPAIRYFPAAATASELAQLIKRWILEAYPLDSHAYRQPSWQDAAAFIMSTLQAVHCDQQNRFREAS